MAAAIEVADLTRAFGDKEVLRGVSFRVLPGEICGYLGPNGAGKTTTVKILCGLLRPDGGSVRIAGFDPRQAPLETKRRIGYLPESGALFDVLTPREYLTFVGRLYGLNGRDLESRIDGFLRAFHLEAHAGQNLLSASRGMKQKVALAAALLHDPPVLLLDEPLTGLDANSALIVKELLRRLAKRGKAILFCSHVLEVVERLCDRVVILDSGRVVADGAMKDIRAQAGAGLEDFFRRLTGSIEPGAVADEVLRGFPHGQSPA